MAMTQLQLQLQWQWGNGNGTRGMGQRRSIVLIAIDDRLCGCAVATFIPCGLFEKVSEWQEEVRINEWRTCLTTLTIIYLE
jgi:hypothetical protein